MVEVDKVADRVDGGEEQGGAGADLVELEARVQRDILGMTMLVVVVIVMIVMMVMMGQVEVMMVMTVQVQSLFFVQIFLLLKGSSFAH